MNPSWRELFRRFRWEFSNRPLLSATQLLCFVTWITAGVLGTYLHVSLPRFPPPASANCYFTDALIILIECRHSAWTLLLNMAWWWTWGSFVTVGFLPYSLPIALPAVATLGFALGFVGLLRRLWQP